MALREVLVFDDPRLRNVGDRVTDFGDELQTLVDDMIETMYAENGCGLAAIQINVKQQVAVIDDKPAERNPRVIINPEVISTAGTQISDEGCLSVPGTRDKVDRALQIKIRAQDRHGNPLEMEASDFLATIIQHEMDHLNGKLFIDYLSSLKRRRIKKRLEKARREGNI